MVLPMSADRLRWLLLGVAAIALVAHSLVYNFITDDAYISFVYARNFAEHGELVFNLGQYVEGYTNFLWTLLIGLGMLVDIPPELTAKILGAVFAVVTLFVTCTTIERALGRKTPWGAVPALLLAASSGYACWTSGGLETQLFTMLCAIAIDGIVAAEDLNPAGWTGAAPLQRGREAGMYRAGVALALAAMTRPEGLLVAAVLGLARVICNLIARRRVIGMPDIFAAILFLSLWAPWFAWRWWYYGYPFPNTYYVKATGRWAADGMAKEMYQHGAYYIWAWLQQTKLLYVLPIAVLGLTAARPRTPRFALGLTCALLAAVYIPYSISVGGDFMGLHRFIMPMFVVAAIALVLGLEWLAGRFPERMRNYAGVGIVLALAGGFAGTQLQLTRKSVEWGNFRADKGIIDTPAFLIVYTEDRATIGAAMTSCFRPDDFSIVGGAGAQPYYGRMRAIDVFGLVSARVAHEEPRIRARAGHTKFASDGLLAQYDPTFVFSCYAIHASPTPPGLSCNTSFWLARGYEQVTMKIPGLKQSGEYYTFLAKKARNFQCPGRVQ
jgi:arabinofuranosyltransferase